MPTGSSGYCDELKTGEARGPSNSKLKVQGICVSYGIQDYIKCGTGAEAICCPVSKDACSHCGKDPAGKNVCLSGCKECNEKCDGGKCVNDPNSKSKPCGDGCCAVTACRICEGSPATCVDKCPVCEECNKDGKCEAKNVMILVFLLATKMANVNPCVKISAKCAIMANVNPSVIQLVLYASMVYVQTIVLSKILVQYAIIMVDVNPSVVLLISVKSAVAVSANPSVSRSVKIAIVVLVTAKKVSR